MEGEILRKSQTGLYVCTNLIYSVQRKNMNQSLGHRAMINGVNFYTIRYRPCMLCT
jgi:hypothetical protein